MKHKLSLTGLLLNLLGLCGCVHLYPMPRSSGSSSSASEQVASRPKSDWRVSGEKQIKVQPRYTLKQIKLSPQANQSATEIVLDYYQLSTPSPRPHSTGSSQTKSPVILLLPISGGGYEVESYFARYFAKHGFAVVLARRGKIDPTLSDLGAIDIWLKQTVTDNQRVLDWIETRPELDSSRIGVFGISMGGIKGALLAAEDHRPKAVVLGMAGGDIPYILTHSTEPGIIKRREAFMREHNLTLAQLEKELQTAITCDPNGCASRIDRKKVLLVLAAFDRAVPFKKGLELREKMDRPETIFVPTGHYSTVVYIFYIQHQTLKFLQARLGRP
jgi:hypothetical protein